MTYLTIQRMLMLGSVVISMLLAACQSKQEDIVPTPAFSYSLRDQKDYISVYPVDYAIVFANQSINATTYHWDFGNGTSSTDKTPTVTYAKSGTYTVQLTTTSSTGTQRVSSQSITILDCVLKRITISGFQWNAIGSVPTWDNAKQADLTLELGQRSQTGSPTAVSQSLYRAEPLKGIVNTTASFTIPVTQRVVLNPAELPTFIINLYGNDGGGNRLVYSSGASGIGFSGGYSLTTNFYTISSGPFTLECAYQ